MITPGSDKEKGLEFELDAVFFEIIFGGEFNPVSPPSLTHCLSFTFSSYIFVAIRGEWKNSSVTAKKFTGHVIM